MKDGFRGLYLLVVRVLIRCRVCKEVGVIVELSFDVGVYLNFF